MPYVIPWTTLTVDGSTTDANDIDEKLTNISQALQERLESVLIEDVQADPWVLKPTVGGAVTGKKLIIPHTLFKERTGGATDPTVNDINTSVLGTAQVMQAPVFVPPGCTITLVEFLVGNMGTGAILWEFFRNAFSISSTKVLLDSGSSATGGVHIISKAVSVLVGADQLYHVSLDTSLNSSGAILLIYGARITYDTPSARETY